MSTRIMGLCWPMQMRAPAKSVLIALADMANDEGYCWPSIERLCERTCYGRTAVIDAIAWLEARGAVRANRTNGRKTTYWVEPEKFTEEPVDEPSNQSATRTGTPHGPVRRADGTSPPRGPDQSATRTLIVINRHGIKEPPTPPADAGGTRAKLRTTPARKPKRDAVVQASTAGACADVFDALFRIHPRRKAERRARRQWDALQPDAQLSERILAALQAQVASDEWQRLIAEGRLHLIPMLSSWLSGRRWEDEVGALPASGGKPWHSTRSGIEAKGATFGMPAWDQAAYDRGQGEPFAAYEARVRRRVEAGAAHAH